MSPFPPACGQPKALPILFSRKLGRIDPGQFRDFHRAKLVGIFALSPRTRAKRERFCSGIAKKETVFAKKEANPV